MKTLFKIILVCAGIALLAGCVEDQADNGYYSSSYDPNYNPATTGYNRDYQQPSRPKNNGYSSSGSISPTGQGRYYRKPQSGYESSGSTGASGYSSSGYAPQSSGSDGANGYSSSGYSS